MRIFEPLTPVENIVERIEWIQVHCFFDQRNHLLGLATEMQCARKVGIGVGIAGFDFDPSSTFRNCLLVLLLEKMNITQRLVYEGQ